MPIFKISFDLAKDEEGNVFGEPSDQLASFGPTIPILVGVPQGQPADGHPKAQPVTQVQALIDTGASVSCIDNDFAESLGLPAVDVQNLNGVAGSAPHTVYLGHLFVPQLNIAMSAGRLFGVGLKTHQVIVGRDFLHDAIMIYDGMSGEVTITR